MIESGILKSNINIKKKNNLEHNRLYVYRNLKENILFLHLKPGEKISEVKIQKLFYVSRAPIREAIVRLIDEALIEVLPQRGTYISLLDYNLIEESVFMRSAMDKEIMRLACFESSDTKNLVLILNEILDKQASLSSKNMNNEDIMDFFNLNDEFHKAIYSHFNKINIWSNIIKFSTHLYRFHVLESLIKINIDFAINQHKKIIESIEGRNYDYSVEIEDNLLSNFKEKFKVVYKKYPHFFKNNI